MKTFDYHAPATLTEAIAILRDRGDGGRALAGGTDLVLQMKEGGLRFPYPSCVVSLSNVKELGGIGFNEREGLRIGAMALMAEVEQSAPIRERFTAIAEGAELVGSIQIRNLATVGGNLCNAAPSADTAPPLIALQAQARIVGSAGERLLPLEQLFLGPGRTALGPGDLLVELQLPTPAARTGSAYQRHTPRKQMDIAVVGVGIAVTLDPRDEIISNARIVLGAVAPTPLRARQAEQALIGRTPSAELFAQAGRIAMGEARPISDVRGGADFRRELVRVMTTRLLARAVERAKGQ